MDKLILSFLAVSFSFQLWATAPFTVSRSLDWAETPYNVQPYPGMTEKLLSFDGAVYNGEFPGIPFFSERFPLDGDGRITATLSNLVYETLELRDDQFAVQLEAEIDLKTSVDFDKRRAYASIWFIPIRKNPFSNQLEKLVSFDLNVRHQPGGNTTMQLRNGPVNSALSSGNIYKLAIPESGIYKIDANFLQAELGINLSGINPKKIRILGNGGGMLPEANSAFRHQDVVENAILVVGEGDGSFDATDYILFYAQGSNPWKFKDSEDFYSKGNHYYDDKNHYFLKIDNSGPDGLRPGSRNSLPTSNYTTSSYDALGHHEVDAINLLDQYINAFGTGQLWFGETFKFTTERDFPFDLPNRITSEPVKIRTQVAGRSLVSTNHLFNVLVNGNLVGSAPMDFVTGDVEQTYARIKTINATASSNTNPFNVRLQYIKPNSSAEGWLDYLTVNARANLTLGTQPLVFSDKRTLSQGISKFQVAGGNQNVIIWDISNPLIPVVQNYSLTGNVMEFSVDTDFLRTFVAFQGSNFPAPEAVGQIANQDLHSMDVPDLLLVYHPGLESAALELAQHRRNFSGINVAAVEIGQVYNEFSSGNSDLTAIRDMAKYFYDLSGGANSLKYLLLFGDASFDYRNIKENDSNYNMVPTYETPISNHPISGFPSDDYFALLDLNEGNISSGALDIGVGRIPARTNLEASLVVNKIIRYETDPVSFGDWKNRLLFNADDEDNNLHLNDQDNIANLTSQSNPVFNLEKNYFDAYQQVTTPGGNRYPDASETIDKALFKGVMVVNYMGHGGSNGWAQERVLTSEMIQGWKNANKLPLFVTATCTFGPYDEPTITSAGELLVLNGGSGAIALFTTVRAVYASSNRELTESVFEHLFEPVNGEIPTIGEILRISKNAPGSGNTENSRKFTLLGDPSMHLAHPKYNVVTTMINGLPITGTDTIQALQEVTIEGYIEAPGGGILNNFNGRILPTVFDKKQNQVTLGNDPGSIQRDFVVQRNVIFKGLATVQNGQFSFTFTLPSDINFSYGPGKVSYYAHDQVSRDANGFYTGVIIGGSDSTTPVDDEDPIVEVFMNNEEFAFGGITDENPVLLVKLSDDKGINTVGTGIGHDITAILDENAQKSYILNDFYESELDNSKKGMVSFPLADIEEGRHSIRVKAWDISNNSAEDYTEFIVASSAELALERVLNYPNPFTTHTCFQFEHNFPGQSLTVNIQIFTISGILIKTIREEVISEGFRIPCIEWDGTDDFGDRIGKGVYVYKVNVANIESEDVKAINSKFEKLVILR